MFAVRYLGKKQYLVGSLVNPCQLSRFAFGDGDTLAKTLSRFWEIEDISLKPCSSAAGKYCEEYFTPTTFRRADGYTVSLTIKDNFPFDVCLGKSRLSACTQFIRNETRLLKTTEVKSRFDQVIQEYLDLGHMQTVYPYSRDMPNPFEYSLHHHGH